MTKDVNINNRSEKDLDKYKDIKKAKKKPGPKPKIKKAKAKEEEIAIAEIINIKDKNHDDENVTGIFRNLDSPGKDITFTYSDDKRPAKRYKLRHDHEETIPRKVAKHINNCSYTTIKPIFDMAGNIIGHEEVLNQRYFFSRVDF